MANTRTQVEIEDWLRTNWLPEYYGQKFRRERLKLNSGGVFDFDAVSEDDKIVVIISTSSAVTSSGKEGVGKLHKLHSDIMFLLMSDCVKRVILLTENDMYNKCIKEKEAGRMPLQIEFMLASIPEDLAIKLKQAKVVASKEVTPK
ncbi:MAG: hypothetical protein GYA14_03515 [Ignavibacteria bacterium]|nr:hypothetical protein [Ignavibacteria bacterium]